MGQAGSGVRGWKVTKRLHQMERNWPSRILAESRPRTWRCIGIRNLIRYRGWGLLLNWLSRILAKRTTWGQRTLPEQEEGSDVLHWGLRQTSDFLQWSCGWVCSSWIRLYNLDSFLLLLSLAVHNCVPYWPCVLRLCTKETVWNLTI